MNTMKESALDIKFLKSLKYINEVKIFNEIQNFKNVIIFDFRKREEFKTYQIEQSIHIPFDEFDVNFFESIDDQKLCYLCNNYVSCHESRSMLRKYKRHYIVLIMSEEKIKRKTIEEMFSYFPQKEKMEEGNEQILKCLLFYKALKKNGVYEMGLFNVGFRKFFQHYDFMVNTSFRKQIVKDISCFPSLLMDHKIYVGNQNDALSEDVLKYLKITHIINVTQHVQNKFEDKGIKYLKIAIDDTEKFKINKYFKMAYEFIEDALTDYKDELSEDGMSTSTSNDNLYNNHDREKMDLDKMYNDSISTDYDCYFNTFQDEISCSGNFNLKEQFEETQDIYKKNKLLQFMFKNAYKKFKSNARILIHCSMGVSRSPTIAIMYLMKKFEICFSDALDLMKLQRQKCQPIDSFLCELEDFELSGFQFTE